jgi:uncharacterized membrane protein
MARPLRRLGLVLLVLALLVLATFVVGFFLAEEVKGKAALTIPAPKTTVWDVLQDPAAVPVAGSMARSVDVTRDDSGAPLSWVEDLGDSKVTWTITKAARPGLQERTAKDSVVPLTGTHKITLNEDGEATRVTVEYRYVVASGAWQSPLFRLMMGPAGMARKGVESYLEAVKKAAEAR